MTARSYTKASPACSARKPRETPMSTALVTDLTIFVLALLVGIEVIGKVPATLHTPLMSATNSIHGIVLAFIAALFAAANVVGGYVVTGRMLKMFRKKAPQVSQESVESLDGHKGLKGLAGKVGIGRAQS